MNQVYAILEALIQALKNLFKRRITLRYPEANLKIDRGYSYDPKAQVGIPGYRGRHILYLDKCTGCSLCAIACQNIANCIAMVKLDVSYPQNKKSIFPQIDYGNCVFCGFCIDPDTPVITNPDVKPISELKVGDLVLTHTGEYKRITKVWDLTYTGPLYYIYVDGKPEPLICTIDHPILVRPIVKERLKEPLNFLTPDKLKVGDYLVSPIVKKVIDNYVVRLYKNGLELILDLNPDLFRLIGYYLSKGFCDDGKVYFHFSSYEKKNDCMYLLEKFFSDSKCEVEENEAGSVRITIHSNFAEDFFSKFGKDSRNKVIPDWVIFASKDHQIQLIKGLGCKVNQDGQKYLNITITSKKLAYQLQLILARLGIVGTLELVKEELPTYHINIFGKWAVKLANNLKIDYEASKYDDKFYIDEEFVYMPIRKIEVKHVKNYRVMDVTVDEDHTFSPLGLVTSNCVDACPFYALFMTDDHELSTTDKKSLIMSPLQLSIPPQKKRGLVQLKIDDRGPYHETIE